MINFRKDAPQIGVWDSILGFSGLKTCLKIFFQSTKSDLYGMLHPMLAGVQKLFASSRYANDLIACVLMACVIMLSSGRVIESTHALPTVVCNTRFKTTSTTEIGIYFKASGRVASPSTLWRKSQKAQPEFGGNTINLNWQNHLLAGVLKLFSSSRFANDLIACVLMACVKMLSSGRVIESTHPFSF